MILKPSISVLIPYGGQIFHFIMRKFLELISASISYFFKSYPFNLKFKNQFIKIFHSDFNCMNF